MKDLRPFFFFSPFFSFSTFPAKNLVNMYVLISIYE